MLPSRALRSVEHGGTYCPIATESPECTFFRLWGWLQKPQVIWQVGDQGDSLGSDSLWVLVLPCLGHLLEAGESVGCELAPEEVGRIGERG